MKVISIFGGTGFIGTELVKQLAKKPIEIRIFTRKKTKINYSKFSPRIKVIEYSSNTDFSENLEGSNIIINLVGILFEKKSGNTIIIKVRADNVDNNTAPCEVW